MPKYGEHKELGQFIRRWRLHWGLGLTKFAKIYKLKPSELSRIERGFIKPGDENTMRKICKCLVVRGLFYETKREMSPGWRETWLGIKERLCG